MNLQTCNLIILESSDTKKIFTDITLIFIAGEKVILSPESHK